MAHFEVCRTVPEGRVVVSCGGLRTAPRGPAAVHPAGRGQHFCGDGGIGFACHRSPPATVVADAPEPC
eukprot:12595194-Alexandrium_andersonii.AAC.1